MVKTCCFLPFWKDRQFYRLEGDNYYLDIQLLQLCFLSPQLWQMLPAGQSGKVAVKDHQQPTSRKIFQPDFPAILILKGKGRSEFPLFVTFTQLHNTPHFHQWPRPSISDASLPNYPNYKNLSCSLYYLPYLKIRSTQDHGLNYKVFCNHSLLQHSYLIYDSQ